MVRLVEYTDTHLREGQWRHQRNFSRARRKAGAWDHTVSTADLTVDGPSYSWFVFAHHEWKS